MTQRQFDQKIRDALDRHIEETEKKLRRLRQAKDGARDVHTVQVKRYKVPEHWVRSHLRVLSGREKPKQRMAA